MQSVANRPDAASGRDVTGRELQLEAAIHDAIENIEGDLYLHAIDAIDTATLYAAIRETKDKLKEASGYVG